MMNGGAARTWLPEGSYARHHHDFCKRTRAGKSGLRRDVAEGLDAPAATALSEAQERLSARVLETDFEVQSAFRHRGKLEWMRTARKSPSSFRQHVKRPARGGPWSAQALSGQASMTNRTAYFVTGAAAAAASTFLAA
jgi:hypothetical protein